MLGVVYFPGTLCTFFVPESNGESLRAMLGENEEKEVEKPHVH